MEPLQGSILCGRLTAQEAGSPELESSPVAAIDLEITWPNGERQVVESVTPGHAYRLRQGGRLERVE